MKKGIIGLMTACMLFNLAVVSNAKKVETATQSFVKVAASEATSTISVTFQNLGYTNGQALTSITLDDAISLTLSKENGGSNPAYYNTGTAVRLYYKNSMTINVVEGYQIDEINFTVGSGNKFTSPKVENGQMSNATTTTPTVIPTDGTKSVKITQNPNGSSGHVRISAMSVKYSVVSSGTPEVGENPQKELNTLVGTYYNDGVYTKDTKINVNDDCVDDIAVYFHGTVQLDRTTYFNGNELWMTGSDINSGYGTVTNENLSAVRKVDPSAQVGDMTHFKYLNNNQKYDYIVKNTHINWDDTKVEGMEGFYVTLNDLTDYSYFAEGDWIYEEGAYYHTIADKVSDSYLLDFLAIVAPCLEDSALSNYFTVSQLVVKEESESLKFQILLDDTNAVGTLDTGTNVLAEATLTVGCSAEFGYVNPSMTYSHTFAKDQLSSSGTATLSSIEWTGTQCNYFGWDSNNVKGIQIGKGAEEADSTKEFTLSTTYFEENGYLINSIVVNASMASKGNSTVTVKVGDYTCLDAQKLTTTATDYAASVQDLSGEISIVFNNEAGTDSSKPYKAMYIKSITVYYTVAE